MMEFRKNCFISICRTVEVFGYAGNRCRTQTCSLFDCDVGGFGGKKLGGLEAL